MKDLMEAEIDFLDDQTKYLTQTKALFEKQGIPIRASKDFQQSKIRALQNKSDILISDLDLKDISSENGYHLLTNVRKENEAIFLCLYTAFEKQLKPHQLKELTRNNIKVYFKSEPAQLVEDLKEDYIEFQEKLETANQKQQEFKTLMFNTMFNDAIEVLGNVSNPEIIIAVKTNGSDKEYSAKDLLNEVKNKSEIGYSFMTEWYDTLKYIGKLKNITK